MTKKKTAEQKEAAKAKREAEVNDLVEKFGNLFGHESKLQAWKDLCSYLGEPEGDSIAKCKKNLKGVYVNIFDFVAAKDAGTTVPRHPSLNALRKYSYGNHKIFPLRKAKNSPLLRGLLVHMSGHYG